MLFWKTLRYDTNQACRFFISFILWLLSKKYHASPIHLQTSLQLGSKLLKGLGVMSDDVNFLSQLVRDSMELQAQAIIVAKDPDPDVMKPLQVLVLTLTHKSIKFLEINKRNQDFKFVQVRVADLAATRKPVPALSRKEESVRISQLDRDRILMTQEKLEQPKRSDNEGEDGRGVLYCELDTDNDIPNQH